MSLFNSLRTVLLAAATLSVGAASASAALVFDYRAVPTSSGVGAGPATVQVPLYLYETRAAGDASLLTGGGLFSAGFSVTRGANSSGTGIATITQNIAPNSAAFPGNATRSFSASTATIEENVGNNPGGAIGESAGSLVTRLFVGTLTVAGGAAGGVTPFTIADTGLTLRNDTGAPVNAASGTFNVTTQVPEPATLAALGGVAVVAMRRRRA